MTLANPLTLDATLESIRAMGPWLRDAIGSLGCSSSMLDRIGEIELALHELAVNIVEHALDEPAPGDPHGTFTVELKWSEPTLTAVFIDHGRRFDLAQRPAPPTKPQVNGYGLMIIEQIADRLDHTWTGSQNKWTVDFSPA